MAYIIPDANALVDYLKDFTGSTNDDEIKQCIFQAELAMRNIELPALRSDPYDAAYIGTVGENSSLDIPADMNKPILFFQQGNSLQESESYSTTGPWLVYDRVGDRDIITMSLVSQFYLNPVNIPAVIRGKFSEVGRKYQFTPWVAEGAKINMYYYRAWPFLFVPVTGGDPGEVVENNAVLQSWPEGYVYGSLHEYYVKRHNAEDAAIYKGKFDSAWDTVENQNSLGKWSGGNTRLTSIWQPRRWRTYAIK